MAFFRTWAIVFVLLALAAVRVVCDGYLLGLIGMLLILVTAYLHGVEVFIYRKERRRNVVH